MQVLSTVLAVAAALYVGPQLWARSRRAALAQRRPRVARPRTIRDPVLGVLRLDAESARLWDAEDRPTLAPLFRTVRESERDVPRCDVLLVYGTLDATGRFAAAGAGPRELARDAGAKVVVVASPNPAERYAAGRQQVPGGTANLVMMLDRKGDAGPRFLRELFSRMYHGVPMPEAWAALAPQVHRAPHAGLPASILASELGDLTLEAAPSADR